MRVLYLTASVYLYKFVCELLNAIISQTPIVSNPPKCYNTPVMQVSSTNLSLILAVLSLALSAFSFWQNRSLNKLKKKFFTGKNGADLEDALKTLADKLERIGEKQSAEQGRLDALQEAFGYAVQKTGLVRFNPFAGSGGNFSFSLALLDAHNNGVIITSMHGREQNRIYAKKIAAGKSESQLTEEELKALGIANGQ